MKQYRFEYECEFGNGNGNGGNYKIRRTIRTRSKNLRGAVRKAIIYCRLRHGAEFVGLTKIL